MGASDSQHVEAHRAHIAKQGNIGWGKQGVVGICAVKTCSHQSDAQFGVCAIMWTSNDAEIEFLVLLVLVGIVEIIEKFGDEGLFLDHILGDGVTSIHLLCRDG